jgi:hypothetical protein
MDRLRPHLKILGGCLMAALVLSAYAAGYAQGFTWKVGGSKLASGEERPVQTSNRPNLELSLMSKPFKNTTMTLTAHELESVGMTIFQTGGNAKAEGKLELSEITVMEPEGCVVASPIKTTTLAEELVEVGKTLYNRIAPVAGETIATIKIEKCTMAGSYNLNGVLYGLTEPLKTELVEQPQIFSPKILSEAEGSLTLGGSPAELEGETVSRLTGKSEGLKFGAE